MSRSPLMRGLLAVAAMLTLNVAIYADPNCFKDTGILDTQVTGTRAGCGEGEEGCHWRECFYAGDSGQGLPGNYADSCNPDPHCVLSDQ